VVAELYTAVQGLGGLLALYGNTFRMAPYFVVVLILAMLGIVVTEGLRLLERRLDRWRTTS
jgi:ABC-type nitrate/sulfonate/bicarbonate transport system permease component